MPLLEIATGSTLGAVFGMRHALEPDHLAAVSTLVAEERRSLRAMFLGMCWGIGHTLALVAVGAALVAVRAEMPPRLTNAFELGVALMLVALGVRAIRRAAHQGPSGPPAVHHHGGLVHRHPTGEKHVHVGRWTLARRPLIVGMVHGLAGSGALTALVIATLPTSTARITYMLLFGVGSTFGMAVLSGLLGWPLARLGGHARTWRTVSLVVGYVSTALGIIWGAPLIVRMLN